MARVTTRSDVASLYKARRDPALLEVPAFDFAMVDGEGAADEPARAPAFQAAIGALYSYCYPLVISLRRAGRTDVKVWPLEGLWWTEDSAGFDGPVTDRAAWRWTLMIRQPDDVPNDAARFAADKMMDKMGDDVGRRLRIERLEEGRCAQILHVGPYQTEGPTIARLHEFIRTQGLRLRGRHHEIYLGDPRRAAPEKLRTILRQPVC